MTWILAALTLSGPVVWTPIPLRTAEMRAANRPGGEGAQWPRSLTASADGSLMLLGIDVGGIYRSTNGGVSWEPANVGYSPRGSACVAVDPRNSKRVISIGANSAPGTHHGIWLSTDAAASWSHKLSANISGLNEMRDQVAFDETSYDGTKCARVVWSRIKGDTATWGTPDEHPALYASVDGGETWKELPNSAAYGGSWVHYAQGILFTGNRDGLYRWTTLTSAPARVLNLPVTGLDARGKRVWVTTPKKLYQSNDGGLHFTEIPTVQIENGTDEFRNMKSSPLAPKRLVVWRESIPNNWNWPRFYSDDGGQTWHPSAIDQANCFLPVNARQGLFAWSPTSAAKVFSIGGDIVTASTDGGKTYRYANTGNNAVLIGGMWNFNAQDPDVMFFGSQDYNASLTTNGGQSWTYENPSGNGWGGYCYGGYAASAKVLVVGNADGWGGVRHLKVSRNGGDTWTDTGQVFAGPDASFGDPDKPNVIFASNLRSTDSGLTWRPMAGCSAVYTAAAGVLYGVSRVSSSATDIVQSIDHGKTWTKVTSLGGDVRDLAYDPIRKRLYAVEGERARVFVNGTWTTLNTPANQFNWWNCRTVAVDPVDPRVVYVGSAGNIYNSNVGVVRSMNSGSTWKVLTRQTPLDGVGRDGGREALCIRVHPKTREAWVSTSCYGIWKVSPP